MKPVDPIHFFNARGVSILTMEDQTARIAELEVELEKYKRLLKNALARLRQENSRISENAN